MQSKRKTVIVLQSLSLFGLIMALVGFYLAFFTDVTTAYGIEGVRDDAMLIALGFLLMVPCRLALTLWLTDPEVKQAKSSSRN